VRVFREEHLRQVRERSAKRGERRAQSRLCPVEIPGSRSRKGEHKPMIPWQLAPAAAAARKKTHSIGPEISKSETDAFVAAAAWSSQSGWEKDNPKFDRQLEW
jgi:hypothetical protein